ncbi:MAG: hypothetical protein HUJ26_21470 [Planctomycetaceae bacterium]|nr:hypothetical protein [Planctomycetaceae bacterium]
MRIPDRSDWGHIDPMDLDGNHALKIFFRKTFEEARSFFEQNSLCYYEDLISMPKVPFEFYAPAYVEYLKSSKGQSDSDAASCFLSMLLQVLKVDRERITGDTEKLLLETAAYIARNQKQFGAETYIYGDFSEKLDEIQRLAGQI